MKNAVPFALIAALISVQALGQEPRKGGDGGNSPNERAVYYSEAEAAQSWHDGWADARVSGDLVFVSGVIAMPDPADPANIEAAFARVFSRLEKTLQMAGSSMDDVVDMTAYLTDVTTQTPAMNRARLKYMQPPFAASTVVEVVRLIPKNAIGEIRVVARVRAGKGK